MFLTLSKSIIKMKNFYSLKSVIIFFIFFVINCSNEKDTTIFKGDYLGQNPPGETPEVIAPGIISHGFHEYCLTISPGGNEMCWRIASSDYNFHVLI
jgi:hypothetical protein